MNWSVVSADFWVLWSNLCLSNNLFLFPIINSSKFVTISVSLGESSSGRFKGTYTL